MTSNRLTRHVTARALVATLFPAGDRLPAADPDVLLPDLDAHPRLARALRLGLAWLALRYRLRHGGAFHRAGAERRAAFIEGLSHRPLSGRLLRALCLPFKARYLLDERVEAAAGCRPPVQVPAQVEHFRWRQQITAARDCDQDLDLEADAVVIGRGAGGAAAAYELASRGLAVVIVEEGDYYDRSHFSGRLTEVVPKLYRAFGSNCATGNALMPVPVGRNVGGTTTINSGTCMRTPAAVREHWRARGLGDFSDAALGPWFEQVEAMLKVRPADPRHVGPIGDIIDRGAAALGFEARHPLRRNAEGCDGQGLCQFGCPTDAKQSTNVSYIPRALERGAFLFTGFRATRLERDGGRVTGVRARGRDGQGRTVRLRVRSRAVVVAMGTFFTPLFLRRQGIRNRHLGRHLTLHPAGVVNALFPDRDLANSRTIPQGFGVADLADQGLMFEGGTIPLAGHGLLSNLNGRDWVRFTESYPHTAYFGFMIRDTSEGRVRRGPHRDWPLIRYHLNRHDFRLFLRGVETLARMYFAAGAREVLVPGPEGITRLRDRHQLDAFLRRPLKPRHFLITAYHPLGTARLGRDADDGVCDAEHRVFGQPGLYVMDGAAVPSSLGANPQVTIMTLAGRAAARLADRLQDPQGQQGPQGETRP